MSNNLERDLCSTKQKSFHSCLILYKLIENIFKISPDEQLVGCLKFYKFYNRQENRSTGRLGMRNKQMGTFNISATRKILRIAQCAGLACPTLGMHRRKLEKRCRTTIPNPCFMGNPVLAKAFSTVNSHEILRQE